ncbi:hypothetical protein HZA43_05905 [Candidatus Peregrinibacteria bacterium]|nr:hypothetical protein [Candidatus Peregrinibacteria bacterium]
MLRISEAILEIVNGNATLQFGLRYRLFNLSQLSAFLRPQIKARTKKEVKIGAVTMHLSRMQRKFLKWMPTQEAYAIENITAHSNLCTINGTIALFCLKFYEKYTEIPGLIHFLVQHFMMQNINIIEISSSLSIPCSVDGRPRRI